MNAFIKSSKQLVGRNPLLLLITFLFFIVALAPHFLFLDTFPPGLAHDEVEYQLSAQSFSVQGTDLSGYGFPLNLFATETEGNVSAFPIIILSAFHFFTDQTLFGARLPYLFISIATSIALYFFVQALFKNNTVSLIASLLFLINPWAFFLSRFATESPFALFFLLIGMTLLLKLNGKQLVWAFLFFFLAFFSYHGAKLIILPLVFILLMYRVKFHASFLPFLSLRQAILFFSAISILLISFIVVSNVLPHSNLDRRGGDIVLFDSPSTASLVDLWRKMTIENAYTPLFINKYTVGTREILTRYLNTFSPQVLFFEGDLRAVYGYFYHGLFFYVDLLFLITGIIFLIREKPKVFTLLLIIALIAPIPSAFNQQGTSYVHRSFVLLPVLLTVISYGIYSLIFGIKRYIPISISVLFIGGLLCLSYGNFLHFYFFRYPISSGEFYSLDNRLLASFSRLNTSYQPIHIYTSNPRDMYTAFLYFFNDPQLLMSHLKNTDSFNQTDLYSLRNITFTYGCPEEKEFTENAIYIIATDRSCLKEENPTYTINNPKDAGPMYYVYNSTLCSDQILERWKRYKKVEDYRIENMQRDTFCKTWVAPY